MTKLLNLLASLKLSIGLLVLARVLVFAGTFAQIESGTFEVQKRYFHAWLTWVNFRMFLPGMPGGMVLPGGYAIGLAMLVNLLANWLTRFKLAWSKVGLHLIHLGLVILLLGEAWTSVASTESNMVLRQGQTAATTQDPNRVELAITDRSPADPARLWSVRQDLLRTGQRVVDASYPVQLRIEEYAANSELRGPADAGDPANARANLGDGVGVTLLPRPTQGATRNMRNVPSAYVTVLQADKPLGTLLLSMWEPLDRPQSVLLADGKQVWLQLRPKQYILPFKLKLIEFRNQRYTGSQKARSYSSTVRLVDRERGVDREDRIWMNHPMRYRGLTFYQAGFNGQDTTVLQVVRNPAAPVPYVACAIGSLGLVVQFGIGLAGFLGSRSRRKAAGAPEQSAGWPSMAIPAAVALVCVLVTVAQAALCDQSQSLARMPVVYDGRLQPLDTVARNSLRLINGKASVEIKKGSTLAATPWLLDVMTHPERARQYSMFRIDNPDLIAMLKLDAARNRFSLAELEPSADVIEKQYQDTVAVPRDQRDSVQRAIVELGDKIDIYGQLSRWPAFYFVPPDARHKDWRPLGEAFTEAEKGNKAVVPGVDVVSRVLFDYREQGTWRDTPAIARLQQLVESIDPVGMRKVAFETFYNHYQPFILAMGLNIVAFLLAMASMLAWRTPLWRSAMAVAVVALLVYSFGIAARIYIQGRPPVTNLYSSAVFIGWGALLLAILVEWVYRSGIAIAAASMVGVATLVIAQNLAQGGDTMASLEAVLDSNFWLTTHVLSITFGYSAVFVAGAMGIAFVLAGLVARNGFDDERRDTLSRMIYATTCFALLFSFIGTLLGGIWADQSWGRFWGWDPKENGAVLIVLWLSIMLHARNAKLSGGRGLAMMAIFANVVTSWSWFGTNMLGVGLHSYGFMQSAMLWLLAFVASQLLLIAIALSFVPAQPPPSK